MEVENFESSEDGVLLPKQHKHKHKHKHKLQKKGNTDYRTYCNNKES